ncbi:hypothetical protein PAESOLCIP111_05567 [Paenibacillus solanacearum]|uniref:S-layer homology domain-containing protein n=1 Tax=Paenibacillus solanacearum TaxID=2048548 RepID=A0A916NLG2_9BACL|nr:S-layer homology domain-containing protein [Paenibacillus solanacearum]CAG7648268.1 hypothetical protein PAESOLCIP111_05567 [Paenibacillus solanacearum]
MLSVKQRRTIIYVLLFSLIFSSFGLIAEPQEARAATGLPRILITELVPNAVNGTGGVTSDMYEYAEIYNNSDQPVKLSDLQFIIRSDDAKDSQGNPKPTSSDPWQGWDATESAKVIPPWGVMVIWVKQTSNNPNTLDDFYTYHKTFNADLKKEQIAIFKGTGFGNVAARTFIVKDKDGKDGNILSTASYVGTSTSDPLDKTSIQYFYPKDGTTAMEHKGDPSRNQPLTTGKLNAMQLPLQEVANPIVTWSDGQATVSWTAPDITGYNDYSYINVYDQTGTIVAGPITKEMKQSVNIHLLNGTNYTFTIKTVLDNVSESSGVTLPTGQPTGSSQFPPSGIYQDSPDLNGRKEQSDLVNFFKVSEKGPIIPGLQQYLVPQGMAYDAAHNWLLISHYREGKSSMLSVVDMITGKLIKAMELYSNASTAYKGHAGGVAVSPNYVWLSSDYKVYQIKMDDLVSAQDGGKLVFSSSFNTETKGSFLTYADGFLWSGDYEDLANYSTKASHYLTNRDNQPHHGWVAGYRLDATGTPAASPEQIFSIPDKIQGMAFVQDKIVLSRSGGRTNMSQLIVYKNPLKSNIPSDKTVDVGGTGVPLTILDGVNAINSLIIPPMSEGVYEYKGKLYVLFESGAATYLYNGTYPVDSIYSVNIEPYLQPQEDKFPELLVTEVSPAPKGASEPNEFVEIYNTTNRPIDLTGYKLYYYYNPGSQPWFDGVTKWNLVAKNNIINPTNMIIQPKSAKIIWLIKPQYKDKPYTIDLFNSEFGTNLTADQFVFADLKDGDAMYDTGNRYVAIVSPEGDKVRDRLSMAGYNAAMENKDCNNDASKGTVTCDVERAKSESIDYSYPVAGINMDGRLMVASPHQTPTPGTVKPQQIANFPSSLSNDVEKPIVTWDDKQAKIEWTDPPIVQDFEVNIYDAKVSLIGTVSKGIKSYTVAGLENGTDYQFTLKVTRFGLESKGVTTETGYPKDGEAPAKPKSLKGNSIDGDIVLEWTSNTEADLVGYKIYVDDKPISSERVDVEASKSKHAFKTDDLEDGKTYQVSIAAVDTSRNVSEKSDSVSIKYEGGPSGFKGTAGDKSATLTWNPMLIDLLGYTVYQNGQPLTVSNSVYTVTYSTYSYTVTGLANGTKYNFAVTGVKKDNKETPKSNIIELTPFVMTDISLDIPSTIPVGGIFNSVVKAVYDGRPAEEIKLNVSYKSADASIVSIEASGQGKALKLGKTVIEATYGSYKTSQNIEVKEDLISLELSGVPSAPFYIGDKAQLKLTAKYSDQSTKEVTAGATYTVDPSAVATVSSSGLLEGKAKGEATIKAAFGGKSAEQKVTVSEKASPVTLVSLEIIGVISNFYPGDRVQLKVTAKYSDNTTKDVTNSAAYTSSKTDILTISSTGMIEGKKTGDSIIKADFGGKSVQSTVSVVDRPLNSGGGGGVVSGGSSSGSANSSTLGASSLKAVKENDSQGRSVTRYEVDSAQLGNAFRSLKADERKVTINISSSEPVTKVAMPAWTLQEGSKNSPNAAIVIQNGGISYEIPVKAFNFDSLAKELGGTIDKMTINVVFTAQSGQEADRIKAVMTGQNAKALTTAYDFTIQATVGGKTVEVKSFNGEYAVRTLEVTGKMDPSKSTGVLIDSTRGTMYFVPTIFTTSGGKTQASIMSQSNSIYAVVELSRTFADVKGHWSQKDVELLASKLVVSGVDDRNFAPDAQITRAQFATMLVTALGLSGLADNVKAAPKFKDVAAGDWFASAVAVAAEKGLISGYENNEFRPNANVTREEMAVMVVRALQLVDKRDVPAAKLVQFSDGTAIGSWASASVAKAVDTGIIQGVTDTSFEPGQYATRAQAATMLKRMLQYLKFMN